MIINSHRLLLSASKNDSLKRLLAKNGMSKGVVRRFIVGETTTEAIAVAHALQEQHVHAALDLLGENVNSPEEASQATAAYLNLLDAIENSDLSDGYISVKLTALGLDQDKGIAAQNLCRILTAAKKHNTFVRVDMEGSAYTQQTIDIVRTAHQDFDNVGIVLQTYLYRTDDDLEQMISDKIRVRLVKGAYAEPSSVAHEKKSEVDAAYERQMKLLLLSRNHPAIATHDEKLIHVAKRIVRENKIDNDQFEFQMLHGIRRDLQETLAQEGYHVRAYIPFGHTWYPYFMRRLAERPANIAFVLKNLVKH
jgi:proline dehydrogenase